MRDTGGVALHLAGKARRPVVVRDPAVTVALRGDLDAHSAAQVRLHLLSLACEDGPDVILVDLCGVTSIDRAGLAPVLEAHRRQSCRGATLLLNSVSPPVSGFLTAEPHLARYLWDGVHALPAKKGWAHGRS